MARCQTMAAVPRGKTARGRFTRCPRQENRAPRHQTGQHQDYSRGSRPDPGLRAREERRQHPRTTLRARRCRRRIAVASPYSCYLEAAPEGGYQWDFRQLDGYPSRSVGAEL